MPLKNVGVHTFLSEDEVRTSVRIISGCVSETAKRMAITAGEYLTAVDGQMKLHGLTCVTKVVNSVGYTTDAIRDMSNDSLIRLLGNGRVQQLALGLIS